MALSRKQKDDILRLLLQKPTISEVAKEAGVNKSTIYRLLKDEDFKSEYAEARRAINDDVYRGIQATIGDALREVRAILNNPNTSAQIKLNASQIIFNNFYRIAELVEHETDRQEEKESNPFKDLF